MKKILIVAASLDGYIAQRRDQVSTAWTSREDRQFFAQLSRQIGTVIMGFPTYQTIGRPLAGRQLVVMGEAGQLAAPPVTDFQLGTGEPLYESHGRSPVEVVRILADKGAAGAAVAGGARLYQSFLAAGLVDELYVTIEPVLLGGGIALTGDGLINEPIRLQLLEKIELSSQTTVFHLRPM